MQLLENVILRKDKRRATATYGVKAVTVRPNVTWRERLDALIFPISALFIIGICAYLNVPLFGGFVAFVLYVYLQMRKSRGIQQPEESVTLRQLAFMAQAVGILGLAYTTLLIWHIALLSILALALGHYVAHRYRHRRPKWLRVTTFVAFHLLLFYMVIALFSGQPYPQAQLAMLALGVVSFDMFSRLNLFSGMGIGMINLYVAATMSRDAFFVVILLVFVGVLLAFFWRADNEDGLKGNPVVLRPIRAAKQGLMSGLGRWVMRFGISLTVFVPLVFFLAPRYAGFPIIPPISLQTPFNTSPSADIINPAIPLVKLEGNLNLNQTSDYYSGFDADLNLAYRGGLSDTIMMYVRSPAWSYWRSHAYDSYNGRTWTQSDPKLNIIASQGAGSFRVSRKPWWNRDYFVQTFYISRELPNRLFTGGEPIYLFIAAYQLGEDKMGGYRLGETLKVNTVYSVISLRQESDPNALRKAEQQILIDGAMRMNEMKPYLQRSPTVTERTRQLTHEVTKNATTRYDKAIAIRDYLLTIPYDYFPPAQPPNTDAVDQFIFEDKRGFCEHYATSMIVMLRELGIPARLAAGYGSGRYNTITGYWEVRANDAHAWVEVYFPSYGWIPFDPTPGWTANPETGGVQRWLFSDLFASTDLPQLPMKEIAQVGGTLINALITPLLIMATVILSGFALWRLRYWALTSGRWADMLARFRRAPVDPLRREVFTSYRRLQRRMRSRRGKAQTVREHAAEHSDHDLAQTLNTLTPLIEQAAYSNQPLDPDVVKQKVKRF